MSYSSTTAPTSTAAYSFKFFPRHGRWTKEMQAELDEHSRRMVKLMMHVQDMHKSKEQRRKDEQREDTDSDCVGYLAFSKQSSGFNSRFDSTSPQPIQQHFAPQLQYAPVLQQQYLRICPVPPGFAYIQYEY